jgi:hypothetical protein
MTAVRQHHIQGQLYKQRLVAEPMISRRALFLDCAAEVPPAIDHSPVPVFLVCAVSKVSIARRQMFKASSYKLEASLR